jgi:hypothetical protein
MRNPQTSLRFYIDQADDKAVIRAVPVKPIVAAPVETTGEIGETRQDSAVERHDRRHGRVTTSRVTRLVHRGRKHS